jgi:hypothetical protein
MEASTYLALNDDLKPLRNSHHIILNKVKLDVRQFLYAQRAIEQVFRHSHEFSNLFSYRHWRLSFCDSDDGHL